MSYGTSVQVLKPFEVRSFSLESGFQPHPRGERPSLLEDLLLDLAIHLCIQAGSETSEYAVERIWHM